MVVEACIKSVGSHLGEENDSTGREKMTPARKVTAWVAGQSQESKVSAADSLLPEGFWRHTHQDGKILFLSNRLGRFGLDASRQLACILASKRAARLIA